MATHNPYLNFQKQINKQIWESKPPVAGQIIALSSGGTYTVKTLDGFVIYNVKNQTRTKWQPNQWVALENIGGDWIIVGLSPQRGGD